MDKERVVIELKSGKIVTLILQEFDSEMEVDDLLRIDYANIMGEILTFPLMYNRIANLRAEMDELQSKTRLDTRIFEHQLREKKRKSLSAESEGKRITDTQIETAMHMDAEYRKKKEYYYKIQKNFGYLDSLYWSAASKDKKLDKMSDKLRPEDFDKELIEGTINGILIKMTEPLIK